MNILISLLLFICLFLIVCLIYIWNLRKKFRILSDKNNNSSNNKAHSRHILSNMAIEESAGQNQAKTIKQTIITTYRNRRHISEKAILHDDNNAGNYIDNNLERLKKYHYVLEANTKNMWFNFSENKLNRYIKKYNGKFCLIVYRSGLLNDAYVMPYQSVSHLFCQENLDHIRKRWIGQISSEILTINPPGRESKILQVQDLHNTFKLLDNADLQN